MAGLGFAEVAGFLAHELEARGVAEELLDFPAEGWRVVAFDGDAGFEEVVGVAFFLAGDGVDDAHGEAAGHGFGGGESAGFGDEDVGGGHVFVHLFGEGDGVELDGGGRGDFFGEAVELGFEFGAFAGDGDDLEGDGELEEFGDEGFDGADAEAAGGDEDGGAGGIEAEGEAGGGDVAGDAEDGIDGDAGDGDFFGVDAHALEVDAGFLEGDEVAGVGAGEPEGVAVEIGDDDGGLDAEFAFGEEPGHDVGGSEVGGDDDVGLVGGDGVDEGAGVEFFEGLGETGFPGGVGFFVDVAEEAGGFVDEVEVHFGIDVAEGGGGIFEDVPVLDVAAVLDGGVELEVF